MSDKKITVTFEINELQYETLKQIAKLESGWHWCNIVVRSNGRDRLFEADFLRALMKEVKREEAN